MDDLSTQVFRENTEKLKFYRVQQRGKREVMSTRRFQLCEKQPYIRKEFKYNKS